MKTAQANRPLSPGQVRALAARMVQQRRREHLQPASCGLPRVREAQPGETPLSPAEVEHAIYHGIAAA